MFQRMISAFAIAATAISQGTAAVLYVSNDGSNEPPYTSPETAATSIPEAVEVAQAGDTVLVSAGFWLQEFFFVPTGVTLRGEGADLTFLDLVDWTDDNSTLGAEKDATVEKLTIGDSGSISTWAPASATFRRCALGFVELLGEKRNPIFLDCVFYGGLKCDDGTSPHFARCTLFGGADFYDGSTPVFEDCRLVSGGIRCEGTSSATFLRCRDLSVSAYQGGTAEVLECRGVTGDSNTGSKLIIRRSTARGLSCVGSPPSSLLVEDSLLMGSRWDALTVFANAQVDIRNCTITGNSSGIAFYRLAAPGAVVRILDTVLAGNAVDFEGVADQVECRYSLVPPELVGTGPGNIAGDPKFVDEEKGDFRLRADSPCIDAGFNSPDLPEFDIAAIHRIMFGGKSLTVDMGAYEFYINKLEPVPGTDEAVFTWSSLADKTYSIFYSDDLFNWHTAIDNFPSFGSQTTSWLDDGSLTGLPPLLAPKRFYRVIENP